MQIQDHKREFENYSINHSAVVILAPHEEMNIDLVSGRCGYDPCGYGLFDKYTQIEEIGHLENKPDWKAYQVNWCTGSTCD